MGVGGHRTHSLMAKYTGGASAALASPQPWTLVWRARGGGVSSPGISTAMDPGMEGTGGGRQQPWHLHSHGPWYGGLYKPNIAAKQTLIMLAAEAGLVKTYAQPQQLLTSNR